MDKRKKVVVVGFNVVCVTLAILLVFSSLSHTPRGVLTPSSSVLLHVVTRDAEGNVVSEVWKEGDIYLSNYANFTQGIFMAGHVAYAYLDCDGGVKYFGKDTGEGMGAGDVRIQVGNGTTAPTIGDYRLASHATFLDDQPASQPSTGWSGNLGNISLSATFGYASDQTVSESALCIIDFKYYDGADHGTNGVEDKLTLLMRDVFGQQTVSAGGDITITYILRFNQ